MTVSFEAKGDPMTRTCFLQLIKKMTSIDEET